MSSAFHAGDSHQPLALVGELCPESPADEDLAWRKVWMAGEILVEIGLSRVRDSQLGADLLNRVQGKLVELLEAGRLTPKERVAAGNTLSRLGDPHFDSEKWFLPRDENLGFVGIPAGSFLMGSVKKKGFPSGFE